MKRIIAIIRPFKVDEVKAALDEIDIPGVTLTEVNGVGRQKGHADLYRGAEHRLDWVPKLELEIVAGDDAVEKITEAIRSCCQTHSVGDGKIFVQGVDHAVRVRTGERGDRAL